MKFLANQDAVKLNQFNRTNFIRWEDKVMVILATLKDYYVLDSSLDYFPSPTLNNSTKLKIEFKKLEEDELMCHGLICNSLTHCYMISTPPKNHQWKFDLVWKLNIKMKKKVWINF